MNMFPFSDQILFEHSCDDYFVKVKIIEMIYNSITFKSSMIKKNNLQHLINNKMCKVESRTCVYAMPWSDPGIFVRYVH